MRSALGFLALILLYPQVATAQDPPAKESDTIIHRLGDLRWQHGAHITSIAVLPGDRQALTSAYNGTVVLWDLETGLRLRTYEGHKGLIYSMALFPDGKRFVTAGADKSVLLWDRDSATPIRVFEGHKSLARAVALTTDGSRIVSGGNDGEIIVWDPDTGLAVRSMSSPLGSVASLAVQPGGKIILVGGPGKAALLDLDGVKPVKELVRKDESDPHGMRIRGMERVAFSPDGRHAAACFLYQGVSVWNVESGNEVKLLGGKNRAYNDILFTPDGKHVLLGGQKDLQVWDFDKGECTKTVAGSGFYTMAWRSRGAGLVSTPGDGTVATWDFEAGQRLSAGGPGPVYCIAVSPDGRSVLSGTRDSSLALWDAVSGTRIRTFEKLSPKTFGDGSPTQDYAASVVFSADGRRALSGHWDCRTALWDVTTGKVVREYGGMYGTSVKGVALSPDGLRGAGSGAPAVIWDLETGEPARRFPIDPGSYISIAFSPDGRQVLIGSNSQKLRLFDALTGDSIREFDGNPGRVDSIAFTPDGRLAASGSESGEPVQLWDVSTGQSIRSFQVPQAAQGSWGSALALSPDGSFLYTRGTQGELIVWDVATGKLLKTYPGHLNGVSSISLSAGGRLIATGSHDSTVILRRPGRIFESKSRAWAEDLRKPLARDQDLPLKRFMDGLRSQDYDVWCETMERGVASGADFLGPLFASEFPGPKTTVGEKELGAFLKDLDHEDIAVRERAVKGLMELGEPIYGWVRDRLAEKARSDMARASLEAVRRNLEARPVKALDATNLAELRAVLIMLELPPSESRRTCLEHFAKGPQNSVSARLARRYSPQDLRR
ncbi:MAG TPA: WD40 repeat domain-containing protein [Planctomycetota bacterium]|nr:WD40 repeat domain-containing protein [Planctomycetota bacterium]